jgi:class 3 adenylate cyclase
VRTQLALKDAHDEIERRNEFIRCVFGRYLTDEVADTLLASPEALNMGGERREISILMADIRGFTGFVASHDAEVVMGAVNNFLSRMTDVIQRYGGTIDEFIGDAILVLFGAPGRMDHHAEQAVACAIEMQHAMRDVNSDNEAIGVGALKTGIGISTGDVIVGNIGSEKRAKYGVVGSNVILAARIESQTEGGEVIVSQATHQACDGILEIGEERGVRLKGFDHDVQLFNVVGIGGRYDLRLPAD